MVHPKLQGQLDEEELLLNEDEYKRLHAIRAQVKPFLDEASQLVAAKQVAEAERTKLYQLSEVASDVQSYVDNILAKSGGCDTPEEYQIRVNQALVDLENELTECAAPSAYLAFIQTFAANIKGAPLPKDVDDAYGEYYNLLDETYEDCNADLPDDAWQEKLSVALSEQGEIVGACVNKLQQIKEKVEAESKAHHLGCDFNENVELLKISRKRAEGLNHSVLYIKVEDKSKPFEAYALFGGKEGQYLGRGAFGKVKLCQNIETGAWRAVKIEDRRTRDLASFETRVLNKLNRYFGETERREKYYAVQSLLEGEDLETYLLARTQKDMLSCLEIAKQAATLLQQFHQDFLHRDIKPKNFVWDEKNTVLTLCDFGASSPLDVHMQEVFGSEGYIAPEVDASSGGDIPYTKKSDMYSLGKTFDEIFKGVEDVPEEIEALIAHMTEPNPEERLGDMDEVIATLDEVGLRASFKQS